MMRRRSWQGGFTLIELMLVVAIIGLLASVAVPAFQRYLRKSRTVEGIYGVSKIIEAARVFIDTKSTTPCDSSSTLCSPSLAWGISQAPNMTFAQACADHGGAFPPSTVQDFNQPGQYFDELQFAPEGYYRFAYHLYSLQWQLGASEYKGFAVTARSNLGCSEKFVFIYSALIPNNSAFVYFQPFAAYGYAPSGSEVSVRGPVVVDNCQESTCP